MKKIFTAACSDPPTPPATTPGAAPEIPTASLKTVTPTRVRTVDAGLLQLAGPGADEPGHGRSSSGGGPDATSPLNPHQVAGAAPCLNNWHLIVAHAALTSLPRVVLLVIAQRRIIAAVTNGAVT